MFKDKEKLYQAYHAILSMTLSWALTLVMNQYYELRVSIALCAFFCFFSSLFLYLFDLNKKNAVSYLLVVSILPILALIFWMKKLNPMDWLKDLSGWIASYNGSEELYVAHHANFIIFCIGLLSALLFYLLTKRQTAKIILAVAIMVVMIILCVNKIDSNKAVVGIGIFYMLTIIVELYGSIYSRKAGKVNKKEGILYLAPICLVLAVLSVSLPSKPEPISWKAVTSVYYNIKEQVEIWKTDLDYYFGNRESEFFVSLTGYSEEGGNLNNNGGLIKDNKVALRFSSTSREYPLYLIGSVSDSYTGTRWEKSRLDFTQGEYEYSMDYAELVYALSRQDLETLENNRFVERVSLKIKYNNIKTRTLFYPIKNSYFKMLSGQKGISLEPANIIFDKAQGKGTFYESVFFAMNLQGDAFVKMMRDADTFSYKNILSVNEEATSWLQQNTFEDSKNLIKLRPELYEELDKRAAMIATQYTALPEELPDRVKELAEAITADFDTSYDKLKAIEVYLQGYTYTLSPKLGPKDQDFIDYFLFEGKEGYCTSFATAMAVLGRCIGIPTRYVEGFVAKYENQDEDHMFPIKNSQAHAWAEAYLEGVGWIPFEATAPFYNIRYTKWAELDKSTASPYTPDYSNLYEQYVRNSGPDYTIADMKLDLEKKDKIPEIINELFIFLSTIFILLVLFISYYFILKLRYKKVFEKADYSKKMYLLFLRILRLLKQEGFALGQQETILMLSYRVKDHFQFEWSTFTEVAAIFMKYRYAEAEVTKKELEQVSIYHEGLANKRRKEQRRFRVWLDEFLFLMQNRNS